MLFALINAIREAVAPASGPARKSSFPIYPLAMRKEAIAVVLASERNPCRETAEALANYMDRSPQHSDCVIHITKALTFLRNLARTHGESLTAELAAILALQKYGEPPKKGKET